MKKSGLRIEEIFQSKAVEILVETQEHTRLPSASPYSMPFGLWAPGPRPQNPPPPPGSHYATTSRALLDSRAVKQIHICICIYI